MLVLVKDAPETIASADVESGDLVPDRWSVWAADAAVGRWRPVQRADGPPCWGGTRFALIALWSHSMTTSEATKCEGMGN
jgi:hypothetical protein